MKKCLQILSMIIFVASVFLLVGFRIGKKEKQQVKIDLLKMKVMYYAVDNPISISANGVDPKDMVISVAHGTIKKDTIDPSKYFVRPEKGFGYTIVDVNIKSGNGLKKIATDSFRIKRMNSPITYFGSVANEGSLTKEEIHGQLGLFSRMNDCDFDLRFMIESFSLSIYHNCEWKESTNLGPAFSKTMINDLANVESGDKLFFHNVIVKGSNGINEAEPRKIHGVFITVK